MSAPLPVFLCIAPPPPPLLIHKHTTISISLEVYYRNDPTWG